MSRKKKAVFSAVTLLIILALSEGALRVHDFGFYFNYSADLIGMPLLDLYSIRRVQNRTVEFDGHVFWKFKPNQTLDIEGVYKKPVEINSRGFRGPDWPDQKPPGVFRVACLGDSTTFGWSVGEKETYPYQLEKILEKNCNAKVEVMNLGVTGYTSLQGRELMRTRVMEWSPDVVVFAFGPNDRLPALHSHEKHLEKKTWEKSRFALTLERLQLYKLVKSLAVYIKRRSEGISLDPATYIPRLKRKVDQAEFRDNVEKVRSLCDSIGADLVLVHVDFPSLPEDHAGKEVVQKAREHNVSPPADWREWDGTEVVRHFQNRPGVRAFDLRPLFKERLKMVRSGKLAPERARKIKTQIPKLIEKEPWRYLMVDNGHPNKWGHEIIARKILEKARTMERYGEVCQKRGAQ